MEATLNNRIIFSEKQQYPIRQYTINEGLSDNIITDILQDKKGYIWIGTKDGLNRFDGYQFKTFKYQPNVTTSLSNNNINELFEDKKGQLWIGTSGGVNLFDPVTETFQHFQHDPTVANSLSHNQVQAIFEDSEGILWFGTQNGLNKFDVTNKTFQLYQHKATHVRYFETEPAQEISKIFEVTSDKLIIGYWGMGLMLFDKAKATFEQITVRGVTGKFGWGLTSEDIFRDEEGIVWVIAGGQVFQYEVLDNQLKHISVEGTVFKDHISSLLITPSNQYVLGQQHHENGLRIYDEDFNLVEQFYPATANPINHHHNHIKPIIQDKAGDFWFGTRGVGLFHLHTNRSPFANIPNPIILEETKKRTRINGLIKIDDEHLWMSTRRSGLQSFNAKNKTFQLTPYPLLFPAYLLTLQHGSIYKDSKDNIWIGTWGRGLTLYHPENPTLQYFRYEYKNDATLSDRFVIQTLETQEEEIWVATTRGLSVLSDKNAIQKGIFKRYLPDATDTRSLKHPRVTCIYQRQNGQIWLGTPNGLHLYNRAQDNFFVYQHAIDQPSSINGNSILSIQEDQNQQLWIGTESGLNKYIDTTQTFLIASDMDGLLYGKITSIHVDKKNQLWLGTKSGLVHYNPEDGKSKRFSEKDGLLNAKFSPNAFLMTKETGQIYIGGTEGISIFHPDNLRENDFVPPVVITGLQIYAEGATKTVVTNITGIDYKEKITLSYQQNMVTFQFAALNFQATNENQYAYKLDGFNDNWVNIGTKREITFTNLNPGNYTLQVKGSNNDGVWNETGTQLKMTVLPPWWRTNWAYSIYALLTLVILYLIYRTLLKRQELQYELQLEKSEASRLKELDSFKTKLYTNLTHEFRTPLTVIMGMADQIHAEPKRFLKDGLLLIRRNGQNLLQLINQLLDLSKLENNAFQLQYQQADIIPYLQYLTESFHSTANSRNLSLRFFSNVEHLVMDYDVEQIKQIMTNLISNALKFTVSGGNVMVRVQQKERELLIEVEDNGIGIAEKDMSYLFDRFFQVDGSITRKREGTGIGLSHTKELVKLMEGQIEVQSELGKGTSFKVTLPIRNTATLIDAIEAISDFKTIQKVNITLAAPTAAITFEKTKPTNSQLPQLLIIEDNPDVVIYLKSCLSDYYQLEIAYNGKIGVEKALKDIPDLIISDVMMPEKDGFEVCDILKNEAQTSHIPFILLTAKADVASRISGLKRGADAYLSKPFNKEELLIRLEALLKKQTQLQRYFTKPQGMIIENTTALDVETKAIIAIENEFLQQVNAILAKHYTDNTFGLPQLCQKIGMSRSQLFRKLKALVGVSPSAYIRSYRLNKAKVLLEKGELNVSEVAWETGFINLAHFSKVFQEEFGVSASSITG